MSITEESAALSSASRIQDLGSISEKIKKKRNLPGNPDPEAEVIAFSPKTLLATNRFMCEVCNKGFQRDQNLQLHRRGHNLPWKLKQRSSKETKKKAYVCPEATCVHHHPSRALGDLTGIKKHYCRKHGEKKWKCDKCSKIYAVQSDWKAHSRTCGTREYKCDCGSLFSRKDSFITHRAFCDALAEESARISAAAESFLAPNSNVSNQQSFHFNPIPQPPPQSCFLPSASHSHNFPTNWNAIPQNYNPNSQIVQTQTQIKHEEGLHIPFPSSIYQERSIIMSSPPAKHRLDVSMPSLSATALLQKAATVDSFGDMSSTMAQLEMHMPAEWHKNNDRLTRDFLGLAGDQCSGNRNLLSYTGAIEFSQYDRGQGFGHADW